MNRIFLIILFILLSLNGYMHNENKGKSKIEEIVSDFYKADYEYENITETRNAENQLLSRNVTEGQVFQRPYREHVHFTASEPSSDSGVTDIYYQGFEKAVYAVIAVNGGWARQMTTRTHPYGYGERLRFDDTPDPSLSTDGYDVYHATYTAVSPKKYHISKPLTATVKQTYYIDKSSETLIKIETDLTEVRKMRQILTDLSVNGASLEEHSRKGSEENAIQTDEIREMNILSIYHYGNPTDFTIPDITE